MTLLCFDRRNAPVVHKAKENRILSLYIGDLTGEDIAIRLQEAGIDFVVLAGYLKLIPNNIIKAYPNRIVNIHPALLPEHGGKGMYGKKVHESVLASGENKTGISIHLVNEHFDEGEIIKQYETEIKPGDSVEDIQRKVRELELKYYPMVIDNFIRR